MSTNTVKKAKKIKTIFCFWLLVAILLFSYFVNSKKGEEINYDMRYPYTQNVRTVIDSSIDFFDSVDSTLNVLRIKDSLN
jgi:energy-converting hydrogenase Eha subunit F